MSHFFKADLPDIKISCSICRVKDYQTATDRDNGTRKSNKIRDDGQTHASHIQALFTDSLSPAVFLLMPNHAAFLFLP